MGLGVELLSGNTTQAGKLIDELPDPEFRNVLLQALGHIEELSSGVLDTFPVGVSED